jgi:hypothetical protein
MPIGSNYNDNSPVSSSNNEPVDMTDEIREQINNAWDEYDTANDAVNVAKQAVKDAEEMRGNACKAIAMIAQKLAPNKKKISRNGRQYTIVVRGSLYFFRGAKEDDTVDMG